MMLSVSGSPCSRNLRMNAIITTPFSTATPDSAMKPTPAEIEKRDVAQPQRRDTPPVSASGTPLKTIAASRAEPNAMNSRPKMISSAAGTTICRRLLAEISCSKVPP